MSTNNDPGNRFASLAKRHPFEDGTAPQISSNFLGRSINPIWNNTEIVLAFPDNNKSPTVLIFSCGNYELDTKILDGILNANRGKGIRFVFVAMSTQTTPPIQLLTLADNNNGSTIVIKCEDINFQWVQLIFLIAQSPSFQKADLARHVFHAQLMRLGFLTTQSLDSNKEQFLATIASFPDYEVKILNQNWKAYICKTFFPVFRDISEFRAILLHGKSFDQYFLYYKESVENFISQELKNVQDLIQTFIYPEG